MNHFYQNWRPWHFFFIFLILSVCITNSTVAQNEAITITGVVQDDKGEVLPGVIVKVLNSKSSVQTNLNGAYSIKVANKEAFITFSFLGFTTQQVKVLNRTIINIQLKELATNLNEVVVIGYGTVNKIDLTGSVGKVNIDDLNKAPVRSFEEALAGRVAGVQVTSQDGQPGSGIDIIIRGNINSQVFILFRRVCY